MKSFRYGRQSISDADIEAVNKVLRSDWLTTGPMVEAFELRLKKELGVKDAVSCSSGTAGLHLAMLALGIGPGDIVVVPGITFVATANAIRLVGADVIFSDVDPLTGLMTAKTLEKAVAMSANAERIRAVIVVHLNGQSVDIVNIQAYAKTRNMLVVEDACHAIGGQQLVGGSVVPIGSCKASDAAVFSFHPVKTVTTAEGGAVTTNDPQIGKKLELYRNHGITREKDDFENKEMLDSPWYYEQQMLGLNYRLNDLQCALGISQLDRMVDFVNKRQILIGHYWNRLCEKTPTICLVEGNASFQSAWHLCSALIDFTSLSISRVEFIAKLSAKGISTQVHYIPVYQQPYYRKLYGPNMLAGCEAYYDRQLSLPLYPDMSLSDVDYVVDSLLEIVN